MSASPDGSGLLWRFAAALLISFLLAFGGGEARAQTQPGVEVELLSGAGQERGHSEQSATDAFYLELDSTVAATQLVLHAGNADSEALEHLREKLLELRGAALSQTRRSSAALDEAKARLESLGPPPADGVIEPPELSQRRRDSQQAVADSQLPVLRAQEIGRAHV